MAIDRWYLSIKTLKKDFKKQQKKQVFLTNAIISSLMEECMLSRDLNSFDSDIADFENRRQGLGNLKYFKIVSTQSWLHNSFFILSNFDTTSWYFSILRLQLKLQVCRNIWKTFIGISTSANRRSIRMIQGLRSIALIPLTSGSFLGGCQSKVWPLLFFT